MPHWAPLENWELILASMVQLMQPDGGLHSDVEPWGLTPPYLGDPSLSVFRVPLQVHLYHILKKYKGAGWFFCGAPVAFLIQLKEYQGTGQPG